MWKKTAFNQLMEQVDSKYTLVMITAKRARSLIDHNPELMAAGTLNAVTVALNDIASGKLKWNSHDAPSPGESGKA
mgnify:CR=1 FL=1